MLQNLEAVIGNRVDFIEMLQNVRDQDRDDIIANKDQDLATALTAKNEDLKNRCRPRIKISMIG